MSRLSDEYEPENDDLEWYDEETEEFKIIKRQKNRRAIFRNDELIGYMEEEDT